MQYASKPDERVIAEGAVTPNDYNPHVCFDFCLGRHENHERRVFLSTALIGS